MLILISKYLFYYFSHSPHSFKCLGKFAQELLPLFPRNTHSRGWRMVGEDVIHHNTPHQGKHDQGTRGAPPVCRGSPTHLKNAAQWREIKRVNFVHASFTHKSSSQFILLLVSWPWRIVIGIYCEGLSREPTILLPPLVCRVFAPWIHGLEDTRTESV